MKVYITGPMTGLPDYNLPAFAAAEQALNAAGYDAVNPGARGVIEGYTWVDYMKDAIRELLDCDGVAVLEGWSDSNGAKLELEIANALGMTVDWLEVWLDNVS